MPKSSRRTVETFDVSQVSRIGLAWITFCRKFVQSRPDTGILITSFTVKRNDNTDNPYGEDYFLILHGHGGANNYVKFRQFHALSNLPHILADMVREERSWRLDKYDSRDHRGL